MVTIRERITEALNSKGWSAAKLSEKSNISKARISQYLNGIYEPKSDGIYAIALALDVSEAWLMGCDVPKERKAAPNTIKDLSEDEQQLLKQFRALPKWMQDLALDTVTALYNSKVEYDNRQNKKEA